MAKLKTERVQTLRNLCFFSRALSPLVLQEINSRKLFIHAASGAQEEAEAIMIKNPELLSIPTQGSDKYHRQKIFLGTPFQAALSVGDQPMWEMMLPYLKPEEALRQLNEQFPEGGGYDESLEELNTKYNNLALAVVNDKDHGRFAISEFKKEITSGKVIQIGQLFNLQHLIAAYQAFINHFDALGQSELNLRNYFWQNVVGNLQLEMTAYDAQIHCSRIKEVLKNKDAFVRSLAVRVDGLPQPDAWEFLNYNFFRLPPEDLERGAFAFKIRYDGRICRQQHEPYHVESHPWYWHISHWEDNARNLLDPLKKFAKQKEDALAALRKSLTQKVKLEEMKSTFNCFMPKMG